MASRRLDISSLLNDGGGDNNSNPQPSASSSTSAPTFYHHHQQPQIVAEPVVLAPHLRSNASQRSHPPQDYNIPSSFHDGNRDMRGKDVQVHGPGSTQGRFSTSPSLTGSEFNNPSRRQRAFSEYVDQEMDRTKPLYPGYRSEPPSQSRPSSSRSSNSPRVPYRYPQPSAASPIVSPSSNPLPVPERFTPPVSSQRNQPSSFPRHARSNSQSHSRPPLDHSQTNPYPHPQPSSSSPSNPTTQFNLLVHIATEERRKLSGGSESSESMPKPSSPPGHQHHHRHQYGGTSDQVAPESVKKTSSHSDWFPKTVDRNDESQRQQPVPYPHRSQSMSIHDQLSQHTQSPIPRSSAHHIPPAPETHASPPSDPSRLVDYRVRAQNTERQMQKMEEQRQKTEEQRRHHQQRLEEQKLLNDQREQRQQQRLQMQREQLQREQLQREQQMREHERIMAEAAARERARMEEKERERALHDEKYTDRPRVSSHHEGSPPVMPHSQPLLNPQPTIATQGASAYPTRRPLSMESLLHPQSSAPPQHQHRPIVSPIDTSASGPSYSSNPRSSHPNYPSIPQLEAPSSARAPLPARKSDPGQPAASQITSPFQLPKSVSSPTSSLPPTLSNLVTSPTHQTVSPSLQALLSPSQTTIRLPPPLPDPRPPKKPRVSAEDSFPPAPASTRLTLREEQTLSAIRDERQRRAEEAAARKTREEEERLLQERERIRRERTREMQLERERESQRERAQLRQDLGPGWDNSRAEPCMEERKPAFPIPITAEPTNILAQVHRPQVIQLLPREEPAPRQVPPPTQSSPTIARERVSPPRVVKLETVETPVEVRQPKRSPPGSQEGRAKAARRTDNSTSHFAQEKKEMMTNVSSEQKNDSDVKPTSEEVVLPTVKPVVEARDDGMVDEEGPGRAKQVAKEKRGSRTHSPPRSSYSDHKQASPPPPTTPFVTEKTSPPSQLPLKQPQQLKDRPPQDDAHEWLLEHYSKLPSSSSPHGDSKATPKQSSPATTLPPAPEIIIPDATSTSSPAITISDDAVAALEQELEDILMEEPDPEVEPVKAEFQPAAQEDFDQAVADLVAETLENLTPKSRSRTMELEQDTRPVKAVDVDVEDELLSLVDDRSRQATSRSSPPASGKDGHRIKPSSLLKTNDSETRRASPLGTAISGQLPSLPTTGVRATPERSSMPPPAPRLATGKSKESKEKDQDKDDIQKAEQSRMKKKPGPKPKLAGVTASSKPRAKPGPKPKQKNVETTGTTSSKGAKSATSKKAAAATSRSRSASAMPGGSAGPEAEPSADRDKEKENEPEEEAPEEDDKLYCVCKTKYDEDRVMIACDRCDEWYHTQCVDMPDLEVDLVDQFICPPCIEQNPHLSLRTTYKKRCLFGLSHSNPSSSDACHKPARGAFSKYCSDECGFKYMQARVDDWTKRGGKKEILWESVKNAERREGVVIRYTEDGHGKPNTENKQIYVKPEKSKTEREIERLKGLLEHVVSQREEIKKGMEVVGWRERLLELASERAEQLGQCGWDQRLCFGDEEWTEFGEGVLESYEELANGDMQVDAENEGEWWCPGLAKCERHAGWQGVRHKDIMKEKENKEEALLKLTTREREIRKLMEDLAGQQRTNSDAPSKSPLAFSNNKLSNGHSNHSTKPKLNGDTKKGKKRKTLA